MLDSMIRAITSTRQAAEWGMRVLKGTWPRLNERLTVQPQERLVIIALAVYLSNLCTRAMKINQIQTVFAPQRDDSLLVQLAFFDFHLADVDSLVGS